MNLRKVFMLLILVFALFRVKATQSPSYIFRNAFYEVNGKSEELLFATDEGLCGLKHVALENSVSGYNFMKDSVSADSIETMNESRKFAGSIEFSFAVYWGWFRNGSLKSAVPDNLNIESDKLKSGWFINADIFGDSKWGIGMRLASYNTEFYARKVYKAEKYMFPVNNEDYIIVNTDGHSYSFSALFRPVNYIELYPRYQIVLRSGVTYTRFNEYQEVHADLYINPWSYGQSTESTNIDFEKALNMHFNASFNLHFSKRLSVMAEVSESIPLINPVIPGSSATVYSSHLNTFKEVTLEEHKQNTAGLTFGFGLTFHFY